MNNGANDCRRTREPGRHRKDRQSSSRSEAPGDPIRDRRPGGADQRLDLSPS